MTDESSEFSRGKVAGLRWAASYLKQGAIVNLDGIEDRLTAQDFQEALMTSLQMFSETFAGKADQLAALSSAAKPEGEDE